MSADSIDGALRALVAELVRAELAAVRAAPAAPPAVYLSPREAAEIAGVAPGTIRRWIHQGRLNRYHAGADVRVLRSDLERLLRTPRAGKPANDNALTPEERARRDFG